MARAVQVSGEEKASAESENHAIFFRPSLSVATRLRHTKNRIAN